MPTYQAYRGQHGHDGCIESNLPNFCFTTKEGARIYASTPNIPGVKCVAPKIFKVDIHIRQPFVNQPGDAYLDEEDLLKIIPDFEPTDFKIALDESCDYPTYQVWRLLDNKKFCDKLISLGFDGAIYGGSGATAGMPEYRVFEIGQIKIIKVEYL